MADEKKLQIDDDWKAEAAAEKQRLAGEVDSRPERAPPAADFTGLVNLLAMQAMVGLGGMAGPDGQRIPPNLELTKHHIDLLDVLEQKTSGNLEPEEKKLLDSILHQLRIAYVEVIGGGGGRAAPPPGTETISDRPVN